MDYAQIEENMAIYEQAVALNDSAGEQILYQTVEALILLYEEAMKCSDDVAFLEDIQGRLHSFTNREDVQHLLKDLNEITEEESVPAAATGADQVVVEEAEAEQEETPVKEETAEEKQTL